jgi:hypothetical protein
MPTLPANASAKAPLRKRSRRMIASISFGMRVRYLPPLARRKIFRRSVLQTQPPSRALVSPDDLEHIGGGRLLLSQSR